MTQLKDITAFLDDYLEAHTYPEEKANGLFYTPKNHKDQAIRKLGLALEPPQMLPSWVQNERLDAVFLHRPWGLASDLDVPVVAYHLAFDEHLTLGYNLRLATVLGLDNVDILGYKEDRPIGMIGNLMSPELTQAVQQFKTIFGGLEDQKIQVDVRPERIAIVGAMNKKLVREASERGATLYLTGQYRDHAEEAVQETGINIVTVGHQRSERWGLRALAGLLRERFSGLDVISW